MPHNSVTKTSLPQNCKNTIQSPVPSVLLLWLYLVSHSFALPILVWIGKIVHQALTRHQASSVTYSSKQKTRERDQRTNRHIFRSIASIIIIKRVFFLELVTKALVNLQFSSPLSDGNYNTGSVCGLLFLLDEYNAGFFLILYFFFFSTSILQILRTSARLSYVKLVWYGQFRIRQLVPFNSWGLELTQSYVQVHLVLGLLLHKANCQTDHLRSFVLCQEL